MTADNYNGVWELIRGLCIYEQGEAPLSGTYRITSSGLEVRISIDWVDTEEEKHSISFSGPIDGSEVPIEAPGLTHMTFTRIGPDVLDSAAFDGKEEVMYARRAVSGDLLSTLQRIKRNEGTVSIFQVYKRVAT